MLLLPDPELVYIIIPCYNETAMIRSVVEGLLPFGYQLIVIDDGSEVPVETVLGGLPVLVARHRVNLGQGAAIQTGLELALQNGAAYLVTFDADGQHQVSDISSLLNHLIQTKSEIVLGSRFLTKESTIPTRRKLVLHVARIINYLFTGLLLSDAHNGLRAITAEGAKKIHLRENRMAHATELLSIIKSQRLRFSEAPVQIHYTHYSQKKGQRWWHSFRILIELLLNKFSR